MIKKIRVDVSLSLHVIWYKSKEFNIMHEWRTHACFPKSLK